MKKLNIEYPEIVRQVPATVRESILALAPVLKKTGAEARIRDSINSIMYYVSVEAGCEYVDSRREYDLINVIVKCGDRILSHILTDRSELRKLAGDSSKKPKGKRRTARRT